jgi:hypothetical protein
METLLVLVGSAFSGFAVGCFYGVCLAGQSAAVNGYVAPDDKPILKLLTAVNANLSIIQAIVFLVALALSLVFFVAGVGVPAMLSSRLAPEVPLALPAGYIALAVFGALGWSFGKHIWEAVS